MPKDPHIFLLGRPPIDEYLGFVVQAAGGGPYDPGSEAAKWHAARARIDQLSNSEAGVPDSHSPAQPPEGLQAKAAAFLAEPVTRNAYAVLPTSVGLVELDRLIVYQKQ